MRLPLVIAAAVALGTVVGCGSGQPPAPPAVPPTAKAPSPAPGAAAPGAAAPGAAAPGAAAPGAAPAPAPGVPALTGDPTDVGRASQARAGTGPAPTTLVTQDIVTGNGPAATLSDTVAVRYTGTLYTDGTVFDSSWSSGDQPVDFPLNAVVPGFAQGIAGMKPGGRRVIVIPPKLGYGDQANGPIPAGSTLVFVVDLVGVS